MEILLPDVRRTIRIVQSPLRPAFRSAWAEFVNLRASSRVKEGIWPHKTGHLFTMSSEAGTESDRTCEFIQPHPRDGWGGLGDGVRNLYPRRWLVMMGPIRSKPSPLPHSLTHPPTHLHRV